MSTNLLFLKSVHLFVEDICKWRFQYKLHIWTKIVPTVHGQIERVENFWWYIIVRSCFVLGNIWYLSLQSLSYKSKTILAFFFIVLWSFSYAGKYAHSRIKSEKKCNLGKPHYFASRALKMHFYCTSHTYPAAHFSPFLAHYMHCIAIALLFGIDLMKINEAFFNYIYWCTYVYFLYLHSFM